eukprot:TRINITY_DN2448_c0_g1_i1.p1 TRINITY_DN2448_c0_g1~~TRINITY_DN2448_c0_g1_i1.p1  ORF type:complete len:434 (+),score=123.00 TRINITY_DN2448_c0_g1_i1:175-1476(+)
MSSVELYIYDLSGGLAKNLGSSFGLDIDGIWHTSIVVYGVEWFFGAGGIENVEPPATTELGPPLKVIPLGRTEFSKTEFMSLLSQLSHGKFKTGSYELLRHNCNNFSQELAELLCGASIPRYILDLPNHVLGSPVAQLLAPFIEKYTQPTGQAFSTEGPSPPKPLFPYDKYEVFSSPINADLFLNKFKSLCAKNNTRLSNSLEDIFRSFFKAPRESSSFNSFIWPFIDSHIDDWEEEDLVPFLDTIRCAVGLSKLDELTYQRIHNICLRQIKGKAHKSPLIFRLVLRIWCNFFSHEVSRTLVVKETEVIVSGLKEALGAIPSESSLDTHAQKGITSLALNYAVHNTQIYDEEKSTIVLYGLIPEIFPQVNCSKAALRGLYALGTYIVTNPMAKQIALALDVEAELRGLSERIEVKDFSFEEAMKECRKILAQP